MKKCLPYVALKTKPQVLFIAQGRHHLDLYQSVFSQCSAVHWIVYLPDLNQVSEVDIDRFHQWYGVQFFSDIKSALLHFGDIDAVVTTSAVPHLAHIPNYDFVALAYELGIPVFELQHGLFQLGFSFQETSAIVGSGMKGAKNSLAVRNITEKRLRWFGAGAVGYPPCSSMVNCETITIGESTKFAAEKHILFLTNFHWNLLKEEEKELGYRMIVKSIMSLPDQTFVISPHPAEVQSKHFKRLLLKLEQHGANNYQIVRPSGAFDRAALLQNSLVAVASVSTTLLDLEALKVPSMLFGFESVRPLIQSFKSAVTHKRGEDLVRHLKKIISGEVPPELHTGYLQPFQPQLLEQYLLEEISKRAIPQPQSYLPIINKYVRQS